MLGGLHRLAISSVSGNNEPAHVCTPPSRMNICNVLGSVMAGLPAEAVQLDDGGADW